MFVDASAIVAILAREAGYEALAAILEEADAPFTSGLAILEAVMALRRISSATVVQAEMLVRSFLDAAEIVERPLTAIETKAAIAAFARYGIGQGHPAQLNLADCFAHACARTNDVPLLFVGNDFSQTDIRSAMP